MARTPLGPKLFHQTDEAGSHYVEYRCPGCKHNHLLRVRLPGAPSPSWEVGGTPEMPTFAPSVKFSHGSYVCHHYVGGSNGQCPGWIQFLSDCTHDLVGQTVKLPHMPAWSR